MCHNYSNGARRCLENWQRRNSLERGVWFIINHPSGGDYYYSWRKTDRNFLQQTSKSPGGEWMAVSSPGGGRERAPPAEGARQPRWAPRSCIIHNNKHPPCPTGFDWSFSALLLLPMTRTLKWSFWKPVKGHWPGNCPVCSGKVSRGKASRRTRGFVKQLPILNCLLWKTLLWGLFKVFSVTDLQITLCCWLSWPKELPNFLWITEYFYPVWQCTRREQTGGSHSVPLPTILRFWPW